ncbi:hypothetical protein V1525DRAFT_394583 [Lipomyces kononenkoae]|uniref:Uncharacterized protein n=1 Tax=Lipomyces kononenkoae TaxID=34357 RepID=A0ACC3T9Q8_LIPKO
MEERHRPSVRLRDSSGRLHGSYDSSSVHTPSPLNQRGVRKSAISNIYEPASPSPLPMPVTPTSRRRVGQGRPVSSSDQSDPHSSARKSTVTNSSRHSDGSAISIRFSIAPRRSGSAYRSFSGASDVLPGTPVADDANSDLVDYDELEPDVIESHALPLSIREAPQEQDEAIELENDNNSTIADVGRRNYTGVPGFYYDNYSSNYNSSEEDPDDSSVSDVFVVRSSPPVDVDVVDETEYHDSLGREPHTQVQQDGDEEDHECHIEVDGIGKYVTRRLAENSDLEYEHEDDIEQYSDNFNFADESQHIQDFDQVNDQENRLHWSETESDTRESTTLVHPHVQAPGGIVYRVRDIIPEEDIHGQQARIGADTQKPKRALIPVYSEGLSLSTFPYINSLAPVSAIVRQQPQGLYATTVVRVRDSAISTILPPMPTQPPATRNGIDTIVGQRYGRPEINLQNEADRDDVDYSRLEAQVRSEGEEHVDFDDPLELLGQIRMHQQAAWNDSMFTFQIQHNSPPTIPRERRPCSKSMARLLLAVFISFPPLWLVMGFGGLDRVVGEIPPLERTVARIAGAGIFVASIIGLAVGLGVGL